jgi:IS5 family transposase
MATFYIVALLSSAVSEELKTELRASLDLLCKLLRENVKEIQKEGNATFVIERQIDKTASIVDQDARNGVKSAGEGFCGYKANVNITQDMFILNAQLGKGNSDESHALVPMIDQNEKHGFRTNKAIGDGKYGTYSNLHECKKRGIKLVTSPRGARGPGGKEKFAPKDFIYDEKNISLICPAGVLADSSRRHLDDRVFHFNKATCIVCPLKEKCGLEGKGRDVNISKYHALNRELKEYRLTEDYKKDRCMREKVEAKFGEMKNFHGLRRARYRGLKRVAIQLSLISMVVNLKRFVKLRWRPTAS